LIAGEAPDGRRTIAFDPARVEKLTGVALGSDRIRSILTAVGCDVAEKKKTKTKPARMEVTTPSWRPDMHGAADLVEEVIRIHGLDQVPPAAMAPPRDAMKAVLTEAQRRARRTRRVLAGRGLTEVITWSFIPQDQAEMFGGGAHDLQLANPISVDLSTMRPSLLPGLLLSAQRNRNRGFGDVAIFELGQAYAGAGEDDQRILASGVRCGAATLARRGRDWQAGAKPLDLFDVKADVIDALAALGIPADSVQVTRDAPGWYHPGRSGTVRRGPKLALATFGEVHPATLAALDIDGPVVAFEIDLTALPPEKRKARARTGYVAHDLMPVRRDFAFVVDQGVEAAAILKAARSADKALITGARVFDVFEGAALGPDRKSIAVEITLQPTKATLTDQDLESVSDKVIAAVKKATGAEIRG